METEKFLLYAIVIWSRDLIHVKKHKCGIHIKMIIFDVTVLNKSY